MQHSLQKSQQQSNDISKLKKLQIKKIIGKHVREIKKSQPFHVNRYYKPIKANSFKEEMSKYEKI